MARGRRRPRLRSRWSADDARSHLAAWRDSGLSLAGYCRRRKIAYERLRRWRSRLEVGGSGEAQPPVTLRPVQVVAPPAPATPSGLILELRGGRRIRLAPDFDPAVLERLLSVLGA